MNIDLKKLQNGSDIRGTALSQNGEEVNLTPAVASALGKAFTLWLSGILNLNPENIKIAVGTDSRITAETLKAAILHGMISAGAHPCDCGLASTPAMFMSTVLPDFGCHGSVMITASHLPFNRNGFKFFTRNGGLEKNDISALIASAEKLILNEPIPEIKADKINLMDSYSAFLREKILAATGTECQGKPLSGMKIIVDAGNGAAGFFTEKVLIPLGADTTGSQYLEPDGTFPNHEPNPENDDAMKSIQSAVLQARADLGIIFDTDVDRAAVVDSSGTIVNRNTLIALISSIILEEHPGTTIVTDSVTSDGLTDFINNTLKGKHHRFKRGYKNVINEALRLNSAGEECHLAIETSGHGAIKENFFLDDGAYLVIKIIAKFARMRAESHPDLLSLIKKLKQPAEEAEFRISLLDKDFSTQGKQIITSLENFIKNREGWEVVPQNYEGIRVSFSGDTSKGWFLMRMSLHDPVIPLNIESESPGGIKPVAAALCSFLNNFSNIKYDSLQKYIL